MRRAARRSSRQVEHQHFAAAVGPAQLDRARVARRSRVARGERHSEAIEAALEREMKRVIRLAANNHNGAGANHNGANHNGGKKKQGAKKNKTVL